MVDTKDQGYALRPVIKAAVCLALWYSERNVKQDQEIETWSMVFAEIFYCYLIINVPFNIVVLVCRRFYTDPDSYNHFLLEYLTSYK